MKTIVNCTAPWLHENKTLWCHSLNLGNKDAKALNLLLSSIVNGNAKKGNCLPNCRSAR